MIQWILNKLGFGKKSQAVAPIVPKPIPVPGPIVETPKDEPAKEQSFFKAALLYTYGNEGELSNDKFDRGGITKYGIILDDLKRIGRKNASAEDIKNLTRDQAEAIYKKLYWDSLKLDQIQHKGVAMALFDIGVVRGIGIPPKYAAQICGSFTPEAINAHDPIKFIQRFSDLSSAGFKRIWLMNPTQIRFKNGWENRARRLLTLTKV